MAFPLIDIAGPPAERGRQYGEKAKLYIEKAISVYKAAYARRGVDWAQAIEIAHAIMPRIQKTEGRLFGEVEGIAQGSGRSVGEILALNARTEILYYNKTTSGHDDGCTGAILLPECTADGHVLHGQNWDWLIDCEETSIILRITPEKGPRILTQTEAGNLARCGMNTAGIGLTGNFLKCEHDAYSEAVPIPFIRRKILESTTFSDATEVVLASQLSFSTNLMISDSAGEAINLETTPKRVFWISPENNMLVHANHFISDAARASVQDLGLVSMPCSLYRGRRVLEHFSKHADNLTMEHMKEAFQDRFGAPSGVCCEPVDNGHGELEATVATILMDTTDLKMWVAYAPYKGVNYKEYSFGV